MSANDRTALDAAADTIIARMLRHYGSTARTHDMSSETIAQQCESWAQWVTQQQDSCTATSRPAIETVQDWEALYDFYFELRQGEISYFNSCLQEYRDAISQLIDSLSQSLAESEPGNSSQLENLREAVEHGADDIIVKAALELADTAKLACRQNAPRKYLFDRLGERLRSLNARLQQSHTDINIDALTGVYSRAFLEQEMASIVKKASLNEEPACLLIIDADHFKAINDTYGHAVGDDVLRTLAQSCLHSFSRKKDFVARYGGEEFIVILREADKSVLSRLIEQALYDIRKLEINCGGTTLQLTASMGAAVLKPGETAAAWFRRADQMLYAAKASGRDLYLIAD